MWDIIILTEDRFTPFIAIYSTTLRQKNPIKWLTDIDTRIHINSICHNYNFYGLWTRFKLGVILCIFLWIITLPAVIALLWSRWNMKKRKKKKTTYTSPIVISRCSVYCHWLAVPAIGLICLCCNHDNNNCLHSIFFFTNKSSSVWSKHIALQNYLLRLPSLMLVLLIRHHVVYFTHGEEWLKHCDKKKNAD